MLPSQLGEFSGARGSSEAFASPAGGAFGPRGTVQFVAERLGAPRSSVQTRVMQVCAFDEVASGSYLGAMRSVGLKTLKNKLSEYIRTQPAARRFWSLIVTALLQKSVHLAHPEAQCYRTPCCWMRFGRVGLPRRYR